MKYSKCFLIAMVSTLFGGCSLIDESQLPITNPQNVIAVSGGTIRIDMIRVNGEIWDTAQSSLIVKPSGPKKNLAGAYGIGIDARINEADGKRVLGFGIGFPEFNNAEFSISGMGISILKNKPDETSEQYLLALGVECPKGNGYYYHGESYLPNIKLIPNGPFVFEQRTKYLKLKGVFDVPRMMVPRDPYMICDTKTDEEGFLQPASPLYPNPAPPATIEIQGIHIDIDTELLFKWCSKGGKCYVK